MLTDSTRSVRPCTTKRSFVVCELPPLVAGTAVPVSCCRERRVLRRLAEPDGSQGASADYEVAVGQQQERNSFGRRDEPEPGPTACVESTWSSSSRRVLRASAGVRVVRRTRERLPGRGKRPSDRRLRPSCGDPFSCIAFVPGREPGAGPSPCLYSEI